MELNKDFNLYARSQGITSTQIYDYKNMITPMVLEPSKSFVGSYDIFSRLLQDRIVFLGTTINDDVANIIQAQLLYLANRNKKEDISLYINTPGGIISSGLAIYDTMQLVEPNIATLCTGTAASMGSILLCGGDTRSALPHSRVLIHQPMGGAIGQASDIEIATKEILKYKEELYKILALHCKRDIEEIRKDADRDFWMTAQEALEYGMIDNIKQKKHEN